MGFTDPFFIVLSFLTGLLICAMSGILTVLTILLSPNDSKADFIITMSLIAFGFGALLCEPHLRPSKHVSWK